MSGAAFAGGRVGVLMGGCSAEREISLKSGGAMLQALRNRGVDAMDVDLRDDWPRRIKDAAIDVAMIALHGRWGEDGCIQGMLEILGIPYTGSGVLASSLCMHKRKCNEVLKAAGLSVPVDIPISESGPSRYPVVLKPVSQGSSIGLAWLHDQSNWQALGIKDVSMWMAEMPVHGVEVAVSVLDGTALPPVEVAPKSGVYDYASKYTAGATEYFCPARIPPESLRLCMQRAEQAVAVLGCRGTPRVDMILSQGGEPAILEVNTIPGMTETSLLPKAASASGIAFDELCMRLLASAALDAAVEAGQ